MIPTEMASVCRKRGFPVECPQCGRQSGRPNGTRPTRTQGLRQQVRCSQCKCQWIVASDRVEPLFGGERSHLASDRWLKAIALVVIDVPRRRLDVVLGL